MDDLASTEATGTKRKIECFIIKDGVEKKAELEDLIPMLGDMGIQYVFKEAYNRLYLPYALAFMPEEIKRMVYGNLFKRIRGKVENEVNTIEAKYKKGDRYITEEKENLISLISSYRNSSWLYEAPLVWKEADTKSKTQATEPGNIRPPIFERRSFSEAITSTEIKHPLINVMPKENSISYLSFCNYYYTLVDTILRFHQEARREGLLSLEDEIECIDTCFFKEGIRLVVDGTDSEDIREYLTLKIEREQNYYKKNLMEVAMQGIIGIQTGERTENLCIRLASMVNIKGNPLDAAYTKYIAGDYEAFEHIDFKAALKPEEEREEIRFIKRVFEISEAALNNGFLEVEKRLNNDAVASKDVFEYGLSLIIDGWKYADIEEILNRFIDRESDPMRKNLSLAKKHAVKLINDGYNPKSAAMMLTTYFNDDVTRDLLSALDGI